MVNTARIEKNKIRIKADFHLKDLCKAVPGYAWNGGAKEWTYPVTSSIAYQIQFYLGGKIIIDPEIEKLAAAFSVVKNAAMYKICPIEELAPIPRTKTKPWLHQCRSFWFVAACWGGLLGHE